MPRRSTGSTTHHIAAISSPEVSAAKTLVEQSIAERSDDRLPPDPDEMNNYRATTAQAAITTFQKATRTDDCDALADLLNSLIHLSDRRDHEVGWNFEASLRCARSQYQEETEAIEETTDHA